ncbi:MAG TPA: hypothetical protein VHE30_09915 [Polyangiaceae bacterium]|nr:hypothetical protein [Polyangiaceae bacterium]
MKTTVEIADPLLARAKAHAERTGKPLRAVIEEGLRLVLEQRTAAPRYVLQDRSVGHRDGPNPLEAYSWQDLRDEIYGGR